MNYEQIKKGLEKYKKENVLIYISYLNKLATEKKDGKLKNQWFQYANEKQFIYFFKKVANDNLYIDGDTITLQFKGAIIVSYGYQAYKNKLINTYPDTIIDLQNVYEGDEYSFEKKNGKVLYRHTMNNIFAKNKTLIGAYCIIKNSRGEFLERINLDDISKMRAVAKTQNVWDMWYGEMVKKSMIKRACKTHFKDIVKNIDTIDNENYTFDNADINIDIQKQIEKATTPEEVAKIYNENINKVKDKVSFTKQLGIKKEEIEEAKNDL